MTQHSHPAGSRPLTALEAQRKYEEVRSEADRLWKAAGFALALGVPEQDRLTAAEMARDVAFCLLCDLVAMEPTTLDDTEGS